LKSILILGASGFIENSIYRELSPFFDTDGTYNSAKGYDHNKHFYSFNFEKDGLENILKEVKPKLIISALRGDFNVQLEAYVFLINFVRNKNCRVLFFLSANVFDVFQHYPSYEYDKILSESIYGGFKIKIEN